MNSPRENEFVFRNSFEGQTYKGREIRPGFSLTIREIRYVLREAELKGWRGPLPIYIALIN